MKGLYICAFFVTCFTSIAFSQVDGDYQSRQPGDWSTISTWQVYNLGTWHNLEDVGAGVYQNITPSSTSGVITVNAHQVTVSASVTADQIIISGATAAKLLVTGTLSLNDGPGDDVYMPAGAGRIPVFGTFEISTGTVIFNEGTNLNNSKASNFIIGPGGTYEHNYQTSAGTIYPATWNTGSEMAIVGYTTYEGAGPSGLNQAFYDVRWNCPNHIGSAAYFIDLDGTLTNVAHDFIIEHTGSVLLSISDATTYTMVIGNDLIVGANAIVFFNYLETAVSEINITRNLDWAATAFSGLSDGANTTLNIGGDLFVRSGSTLSLNGGLAGSGAAKINLAGDISIESSAQLNKLGSGAAEILFMNESPVVQSFSNSGTIANSVDFTVNSLAIVDFGTSALSGSGTFESSGEVRVGSLSSSGAVAGNIPVTRLFNSGSMIRYSGESAQYMGNHHSFADVIIDNSSGVTLAANASISGNLTLASGNLNIGARTLTLEGNLTANSNFLNVTTSSNLTINGIGPFGTLPFSGSSSINNFSINRTTSGNVTLGSNLTITGTLTQTDGDIVLNGHTLTINGPYSRTNGSLNVSAGSDLVVGGSGALPASVSFGGDLVLDALTIGRAGATLSTNSSVTLTNLQLSAGTFDNIGSVTMATGGVISRTEAGTMNNAAGAQTAYDVIYNNSSEISTGPELPSNTSDLRHLQKAGGGLLNLNGAITVNGNLTFTNGSFNAGSFAINLKGNLVADATSTLTSSVFTFSGTSTITGLSSVRFGKVIISGGITPGRNIRIDGDVENNGTLNAGTFTTTFGGTTAITGGSVSSFKHVVISGTLTAPASSMNIGGDLTNNGTFTHNSGTVVFDGNTTLSGTAPTSFHSVSITGSLTAPEESVLNIAGNLSNTGTFTHNGGSILFNGTTSAQAVSGAFTFNNIDISNPSKVNNNGTIVLLGTLSLVSSGAFDADGASDTGVLTIRSAAVNEGGRIAELGSPANFTGQVTIERFVNGPQGWRYLSMPITNGNAGMWQGIFPVTGKFSNPSPAGVDNVTNSRAPSIYYWNASTQAYGAVGSNVATGSTSLSNLVGYSPYTYRSDDFTISVRGNIRAGNAPVPIASSGFALVPNPYPSAIDWDEVDRTGLSSTMSIRVANGVFASYVAGGLATNPPYPTWTGEVAAGQSFWIESAGATSLNLAETAKTGGQYQFLRQARPANFLRIALSSESQRDETLVWFVEGASKGHDPSLDARKMPNGYFDPGEERVQYLNISTQVSPEEADFAINAIAPLSCNTSIFLRVRDVAPGTHSLEFSDIETMSFGYRVILVDRFVTTEKVILNGDVYQFEVSEDSASFADDRFALRFVMPGTAYLSSQTPPSITIASACGPKSLDVEVNTQKGVYYQFLHEGNPIGQAFSGNGAPVTVRISKSELSAGNNRFSLEASVEKGCDRFVYPDVLSHNLVRTDSVFISKAGTILTSSVGTGNQWYKDGDIIEGATGPAFDAFESGEYRVQVSFGGCFVYSESVELNTDPFAEEFFKVYPNPTSGKFQFVLPQHVEGSLRSITLYDLKGIKILDHESNPELLKDELKTVDLTYVEKGLYMLSITSGGKVYRLKVIRK